jgi:tripartite-type tricarboxylate transporter receptor subunit TctC
MGRKAVKLRRRQFLHLAAAIATLPSMGRFAQAQSYPSRPVRIIATSAAGGAQDILARLMGQWLSERLGQRFFVENRPGGAGNVGTEAVVRAPADGHTLLLVSVTNILNVALYDKLSYDFLRDIAPIAGIIRVPNVMTVNPSVPAQTVPEFIAFAKSNPGKVNMALGVTAPMVHVAGELFKMMAGLDIASVPYRGGGPALADLLGGQVQVMFPTTASSIEHIRTGKLRALAVTTAARSQVLPNLPIVGEFVPGYEASAIFGLGAPKDTPRAIIELLNREINVALVDPKMKPRLAGLGADGDFVLSPTSFSELLATETEKWSKVIKFAGIKPQ